ncbi:MAG: hypothetical protein Q8P41_08050 [Pseudomonadota bacterium]|nr:hypothetical protein [Pseudomonadota bacterium]
MTATALAAVWAAVAPTVATSATFPPPALDARVWEEVANGKIARRTIGGTTPEEPATVLGVGVLDVSREEAWLSLTDDRLSAEIESLTEVALQGTWAAPKRLYQRLDLPWPLNDRHWVIALTNNARLATASGVWERAWTLRSDLLADARARTDTERFDAAETVTVNQGGWLLVPLADGDTLAVYQARATLGGAIPDGAVDSYTRSSMTSLFEGVERNVAKVRPRYGPGCAPQPGADGAPIPCFR